MKSDRVLNVAVVVTSAVLLAVLAPGLLREAQRAPGGGAGETVVAGEVIRPSLREIKTVEGEVFEISLEPAPSGGQWWEPAGLLDGSVVRPLERGSREEPGSPAGYLEAWRFEALSPGEAVITMALKRDGDPYPLKTESWHLVVISP